MFDDAPCVAILPDLPVPEMGGARLHGRAPLRARRDYGYGRSMVKTGEVQVSQSLFEVPRGFCTSMTRT